LILFIVFKERKEESFLQCLLLFILKVRADALPLEVHQQKPLTQQDNKFMKRQGYQRKTTIIKNTVHVMYTVHMIEITE